MLDEAPGILKKKRRKKEKRNIEERLLLAALVIYWIPGSSSVKGSLCYCMKPEIRRAYYFILGLRGDLNCS